MRARGSTAVYCLLVLTCLMTMASGIGSWALSSLTKSGLNRDAIIAFNAVQAANEQGITQAFAAIDQVNGVFQAATYTMSDTLSNIAPGCTATVSVTPEASANLAWVSSTVTYRGSTKSLRTLIKLKNVGIWNNAIFAGTGAAGQSINGNVNIRGSVHILGEGEAYTDLNGNGVHDNAEPFTDKNGNGVWDPGEPFVDTNGDGVWNAAEPFNDTNGNGVYDPPLTQTDLDSSFSGSAYVGNNYSGIPALLQSVIPSCPQVNSVNTLGAEVRSEHGRISISGSASIGASGVIDGGLSKATVDGVYVNDGFTGTKGASSVFSDNGTSNAYDLSNINLDMPLLSGIGAQAYIDSGGTNWSNEGSYLSSAGVLSLPVNTITSTTTAFSYGPDAYGNSVSFTPMSGGTAAKLTVNGIVRVTGNLQLGSKDTVTFAGKGTLYATGNVNIDGNFIPATGLVFPNTTTIGIMAAQNINLATGNGSSQLTLCGAFYAQDTIKSAKQNNVAGTFVANYFDMGTNVPSIYQVPSLTSHMPPGLPGNKNYYSIQLKSWRERH